MKVLLLQDIKKMGNKGDLVEVSDGYASAYLIPRGLAKKGTLKQEKQTVVVQQKKADNKAAQLAQQQDLFAKYNKKTVSVTTVTNPSGKLFSAVQPTDISELLPGFNPAWIQMKGGIKELGDHTVAFKIGSNTGHITVSIQRG